MAEEDGSRFARMTHLSDDEAVAKMGHPGLWLFSDTGHPALIDRYGR
jgi:hypothetical protein